MAALEGRNGVGVAAVVEHQDIARVLLIPQVGPAGGCLVHHGGIIDNAGGAEHIRHSIGIFRVIVRVAVFLVDLLEVGDVVVIQRLEHSLVDHLGDHIVRRDDHVVIGSTGFQFGVHGLVGVEGCVVHLDAGELLEGRHHIHAVIRTVGDILAPVVDVQGDVLALEAGPVIVARHRDIFCDFDGAGCKGRQSAADRHCQREQQNRQSFHHTPSPLSAFWSRR